MSLLKAIREYIARTKDDWNYITPRDFYHQYHTNKTQKGNYVLIDIRREEDFAKFHIPGAKNIFWLDLFNDENLRKIPMNKKIFLICYVGHTSSQVMTLLKLLGFDVVSIKFGYGISPAFEVPVAGWTNYLYPTVSSNKSKVNK